MHCVEDAVFEIDAESGIVTFYKCGPWKDALNIDTGLNYGYEDFIKAFVQRCVDRDQREQALDALSLKAVAEASGESKPLLAVDILARSGPEEPFFWYTVSVLAPICGKVYAAIQNTQQEKECELRLRYMAEYDQLSCLLNRAAFESRLVRRLESRRPGAFLMIDIDDFKKVNDTKGHVFGDMAITKVAAWLRDTMPADALIGRFGGDEFVAFVPEADAEAVKRSLDMFSASSAGISEETRLTFSVGAALFPQQGDSMGELLEKADRALYSVKSEGKSGGALYNDSMPAVESIKIPALPVAGGALRGQIKRHATSLLALLAGMAAAAIIFGLMCARTAPVMAGSGYLVTPSIAFAAAELGLAAWIGALLAPAVKRMRKKGPKREAQPENGSENEQ